MSADVWINEAATGDEGAALNITYNLSAMLRQGGFVGWRNIEGKSAQWVGRHIIEVLDRMDLEPDKWRAMNPENGWGDYDKCIQGRMREWARKCRDAGPDDTIGAGL